MPAAASHDYRIVKAESTGHAFTISPFFLRYFSTALFGGMVVRQKVQCEAGGIDGHGCTKSHW